MKQLVRIGASAILATIALSAFNPTVNGVENESFGLTPQPERVDGTDRSSFSIPLEQGATFEDSIRVYNRTDQPIELAVYAADANTDVDTAVSVGLRESQPKGVGAWIDLSENQLTLPGRGEMSVTFRVEVKSSDPSPDLGAIVVEPTGSGLADDSSNRRLSLVVRTAPPNSPTTSVRVRPLLLRSPWIIVAIIGLLVALVVIVIGTRRARRTKDLVVPAGEIEHEEEDAEDVQEASRPVIRRLGEPPGESRPSTRTSEVPVVRDERFSTAEEVVDDRPMLDDDMLVEVDNVSDEDYEDEEEEEEEVEEYLPPARSRQAPVKSKASARKSAPAKAKSKAKPKPKPKPKSAAKPRPKKVVRKAAKKPARQPRNFIPLDDL